MVRASATAQDVAMRARIVLQSADSVENADQAMALRVDKQRVSRWRVRWAKKSEQLERAEEECASDKDLEALIANILSDAPRPGGPATFSPEQLTAIIALACEKPEESGLPISHWTSGDLAREAIKRGIVASISARHIGRFLKRSWNQTAQEPLLAYLTG